MHGITSVHREIHKDLLDLRGIQSNLSQSRTRDKRQVDIFSDEPMQSADDATNHRVQFCPA